MKTNLLTVLILIALSACQSGDSTEKASQTPGVHTVVVTEVSQANQYTYLHVKEDGNEPWLAVPKMEAKVGETYYYKGGLVMKDFVSKDLNKTFSEILFLDNISTTAAIPETSPAAATAQNTAEVIQQEMSAASTPTGDHSIASSEVLQTSQYTYIHGSENGKDVWIAVAKMDAKVGKTYYYKGGLPMLDFASKELKRTFKEVFFVDFISDKPLPPEQSAPATAQAPAAVAKGTTSDTEKMEVKLNHSKEELTIAKLYENKKLYADKTVKIKGKVTKFNSGILKRNWIHIQDGTDYKGKFDLAITTDQEVKVGDVVTVEGIIYLEKDFGFGYFYDVIMENAKLVN